MSSSASASAPGETTLRSNALSLSAATLVGLGYCGLAVSAYAILPYAVASTGSSAIWGVLLTTVMMIPTAACIYMLSKRNPSAGGAYTWATEGLGPLIGAALGFAIVMMVGPVGASLQPAIGGTTFNSLLDAVGVHSNFTTGIIGALIFVIVGGLLVAKNVTLSTKAVSILFASEAIFMVLFFGFIIIKESLDGNFANIFSSTAFTAGFGGFKASLIFVVFALAVVDVPASMAEETKEPHKNIPKMTALILGLAAFACVFSSYALAVAVTPGHLASDIANANQVGPVYLIAEEFIGWGKYGVIITSATSIMALFVACILFAARFTHAMSRDGLAPQWLGRLHPTHQTPRNAQILYVALAFVLVVVVGIWQNSSLAAAYAWGGAIFSGLVLGIYVMINVTAIAVFAKRRAHGEHYNVISHVIVPVLGVIVIAWFLWEAFLSTYWSDEIPFSSGKSIVIIWVGIFIVGGIVGGIFLGRRKSAQMSL